jgi:soluble lytic murein transglycosylase-like protein
MNFRSRFLKLAACALVLIAAPANAEIAVLTSGRTLSIKSHRIDGDNIILKMRDGGEVTCDKSLIEEIVPDEIPFVEPQATVAPDPANSIQAPDVASSDGPYSEIITAMARAHGVDPLLVQALIQVESNYRPTARSHKGAMGLMQLMPSTARQYNVRNPYDPQANITAGVKHLKSLIDRYRGVELALAAYNAGEAAVKKFNGIPPYRETRNYITRILALAGIK